MAAPATAQTGYPPGPCNVLSGTQFAGNVTVGQTFTVTVAPVCLFTPGSTANIVVNGAAPFTKTVNPDGTVTLTITVVSPSELSVNPIVPAVCGLNTIRVTAPSDVADDRLVTQNVTFNLICPGAPTPPPGDLNICTGGDGGAGGPGLGVGGTGAGGAGGAGGDACNVNIGGPAGGGGPGGAGGAGGPGGAGAPGAPGAPGQTAVPSKSLLARTGSTVAPFLVAAFALVLVGTALTVTARRRRGAFR